MRYVLLNPNINGKEFSSEKKTAELAASDIWSSFSENIKNYIPEFYFTIKDTKKNNLYHYQVKENLQNERVKFTINKFKSTKINEKSLLESVNKDIMEGGKHKHRYNKDDDSSSSSSSDVVYKFGRNAPLYNTLNLTYYPSIYGVSNILLPSFTTSFTPFIRIGLPVISPTIFIP
jgi:hypothetical protein